MMVIIHGDYLLQWCQQRNKALHLSIFPNFSNSFILLFCPKARMKCNISSVHLKMNYLPDQRCLHLRLQKIDNILTSYTFNTQTCKMHLHPNTWNRSFSYSDENQNGTKFCYILYNCRMCTIVIEALKPLDRASCINMYKNNAQYRLF